MSEEKQIEEAIREAGPIHDTTRAIGLIKALIQQRERMAWEAARKEDVDTMGYLDPEEWVREYTYPEFDDWKKEPQSFDPAQDEAEHLAKIRKVVEGEE